MKKYSRVYLIPAQPLSQETLAKLKVFFSEYNAADVEGLVGCVEWACRSYLGQQDRDAPGNSQRDLQKKLKRVHNGGRDILDLLKEDDVRLALEHLVQRQLVKAVDDGNISHEDIQVYLDPYQKKITMGMLRLYVEATMDVPDKRGPGRPVGSRNKAAHQLAQDLCHCCINACVLPTNITNDGSEVGLLHQVLGMLRYDLNLGIGDYDGIFKRVVADLKHT